MTLIPSNGTGKFRVPKEKKVIYVQKPLKLD